MLVMIPVGAMLGFLLAAIVTYVMPKEYESSATIEVKPRPLTLLHQDQASSQMTEMYLSIEFEKIKSRASLLKVIEGMDLKKRWGMDEESVVRELKRMIHVENIRGTDLISLRVRSGNKEDARDTAAGVAMAYKEYREELAQKRVEKRINGLKKAVREQEDKVEERRRISLRESGRVGPYLLDGSNLPRSIDGAREKYSDAGQDFEIEKSLLDKLKLKLISAEIDADMEESAVVIHEEPEVPDFPVSPNVTRNLVLGAVGGALLSPLLALPLMWVLNRKHAS